MSIAAKTVKMTVPEIALIAITRVALGVGAGLLLSEALKKRARRAAGVALLSVGLVTTVPLVLGIRAELE